MYERTPKEETHQCGNRRPDQTVTHGLLSDPGTALGPSGCDHTVHIRPGAGCDRCVPDDHHQPVPDSGNLRGLYAHGQSPGSRHAVYRAHGPVYHVAAAEDPGHSGGHRFPALSAGRHQSPLTTCQRAFSIRKKRPYSTALCSMRCGFASAGLPFLPGSGQWLCQCRCFHWCPSHSLRLPSRSPWHCPWPPRSPLP